MVSLHQSPVSSQAIVGAVRGAFRIGLESGTADPEHLKRLSAIADACDGYSWEEIAGTYGPQHADAAGQIVGSFFGKAFKKLGKIAKGAVKFASPALNLIPGGSLATAAFNTADKALRKNVVKQQHVRPAQRAPLRISPQRAPAPAPRAAAPAGGGMPQFLPYPYPLPYPVPGWGAAPSETPGLAWPPR